MTWQKFIAFLRLGRPLFLGGGLIFHALGLAIAAFEGVALDPLTIVWGQMAITATQWMTHYANDYFDQAADAANVTPTQWSGGSRMLVEGRLPPWVALITAVVLAVVALAAAVVLAGYFQPAWGTIPLLALTLLLAWSYSAPPLRLHSRGLGALTVALVVPTLTPAVGYYLQAGRLSNLLLVAVVPLAFLQMAMIWMINFPDAAGDRAAGKRTAVVRLGQKRAVKFYLFILLLTYLPLPLWIWLGLPWPVAVAIGVPLPLAVWLGWQLRRGAAKTPPAWNRLGFGSVILLMGSAILETAVFWVLAWVLAIE